MPNPPIPAIGVSAIVFDDSGRVLLIKRAKPPAQGLWHAPGGKLEPGESLVEACRREVREETGLDVIVGPIMAVVERRLEGFHYVIVDFLARLETGNTACHPADDALDVIWVTEDELPGYAIAEGLLPILDRARNAWRGEALGLSDITGKQTDFVLALPTKY
jgi:ADP-ribose pyrophosphatase YjhB (NUDIX family)